ncbi:MAG: serine/threonine protein kinase [Acidobacteria bacterium]|nr:serine/threonine protein kinase [Acidobacteriota bacterium]
MPDWRDAALLEAQAFYSTPYEDDHGEPVLRVWNVAGSEYIRLLYADNTEFILDRRGTQIWVTWPQSQTLEDAATYLLGPVLGLVLRLRGVTCLHASAVVLGERAIALVGASGAGKSTTAAAFAGAGYQVLADDIVALDEVADRFWVRPAYPRVRLWPSSVEALFGSEDALPLMTPTWDKRYLDLAESRVGFQRQPVTLAAIYVLDERSSNPAAPFVESLPDNQKLVTLVANTYANYLLEKPMRAAEFGSLGRLCRQIPLRKITPHADPKFIPKLCQSIVEDVQNLPRPLMRFARSVENEAENQSASLEQLCIA